MVFFCFFGTKGPQFCVNASIKKLNQNKFLTPLVNNALAEMAARRTLDFWLCKRKQIPSFRSPISKGVCFVNFVDYSSKGSRKNSQKFVQYIRTKVRSFAVLSIFMLLKISSNMNK